MHAVDIIVKKREKRELTREEIEFFVQGFTKEDIPDYQVSAWAMAVLLNGMNERETSDLTLAMAHSGEVLDLSDVVDFAVDKHSTGGVGDKTSLVVLPIVAACGLSVGKMSGRGLGFSGGTIDKIESIPGYCVNLSTQEFKKQFKESGIVLTGQTPDLAPADGKLYALRDVTGTVQSIPLIASSIMSKKIASGAQAVVLDVKVGLGAFMRTLDEAYSLSYLIKSIGEQVGCKIVTLLSNMDQPLGNAVGNALEVQEAIDTLHGRGPADLSEHCRNVSAQMLVLGRLAPDFLSAYSMAKEAMNSGGAYEKFCDLVKAQGGDVTFVNNPKRFPKARYIEVYKAPRSGYLSQVNARIIGEAAVMLGAGRVKKDDPIDHSVGLIVHEKVGKRIHKGTSLVTIYANDDLRKVHALEYIRKAFTWSDMPIAPLPLFYKLLNEY